MKKHREVPDLLRDFVQDDRERGSEPHRHAYHEAYADNYSVDKVVNAVREKNQFTDRVNVRFPLVFSVVVPVKKFLQGEKNKDPDNYEEAG